jgi:antibiotic biosynthesis monooxygenase (ABM) superfamily enzyme
MRERKGFRMKYYILANRTNLDGYAEQYTVSVDNDATDDYDQILFFDTKEEAENWTKSAQAKEWKYCTFDIVEEQE